MVQIQTWKLFYISWQITLLYSGKLGILTDLFSILGNYPVLVLYKDDINSALQQVQEDDKYLKNKKK